MSVRIEDIVFMKYVDYVIQTYLRVDWAQQKLLRKTFKKCEVSEDWIPHLFTVGNRDHTAVSSLFIRTKKCLLLTFMAKI